jgi:hypothetical protein
VAVSQSISKTEQKSVNFSLGVDKIFNVGGSLQFGESTTSGTVDTSTFTSVVTQTEMNTVTVSPSKAIGVVIKTWPVQYSNPFTATVTVDADLSSNQTYHYLSDMIPIDKRTFQIVGTVDAADAAQAVVDQYDIPFDPSQCPAGSNKSVSQPLTADLSQRLLQSQAPFRVLPTN